MQTTPREKAFNAPPAVLLIAAVLLGLFAVQSQIVGVDAWNARFGLRPEDLTGGRSWTAITYIFAHSDWMHAGMNTVGALAFGTPLARRLGDGAKGMAAYVAFFLLCGAVSGLAHALLNLGSSVILVGASGAVFGLIGAATRLMNPAHHLESLRSPRVLAMTAVWCGVNVMIGVLGSDPVTGVQGIAWEAHLAGLFMGLGTVGLWLRLLAPRRAPAAPQAASEPAAGETRSGPRSGPWGDA